MKEISFEEAIKALEDGKKVYKSDGKAYYERKTILHYNFNDEDYNKYEARNNNPQEWESLYLPEEPKPFEITETGLYITREGRMAMVFVVNDRIYNGKHRYVVDGDPEPFSCFPSGLYKQGEERTFDIIGKWDDDEEN